MKTFKTSLLKDSIKWHTWLSWTGGLALLMFALSGMTHPLMTWTGPKAASFFPPQVTIKAEHAAVIPRILKQNDIKEAIMVKVVPSKEGAILQVTEHNDKPRRYYDLASGEERIAYDAQHAIWLARYYTGLKDQTIKSITFQTEFDAAYPWVNRLMPVYRIVFNTTDHRTAFIYTELGALAGLTNTYKTWVQSIFRMLHTWSWLDHFENARVVLMLLLLLSLFGLAATGTAMVFLMKNRKMDRKRQLHRFISYGIWIPLLAFSASGIYHLLQYAYGDNHRGLQLGAPINVEMDRFGHDTSWLDLYHNVTLNGLSVVEGTNGNVLYRLSIPHGRAGQQLDRATRFDGVPIEKPALFFDAKTGEEALVSDKDMAILYATQLLGFDQSQIVNTKLVTRFGPHYDFRNKRLPVWRIDYDTDLGDRLFIDPATGMLVDRLVNAQRYESYSFSFLHKWAFLTPLTGRMTRDVLIIVILSFAVLTTLLGYVMALKKILKKGNS